MLLGSFEQIRQGSMLEGVQVMEAVSVIDDKVQSAMWTLLLPKH